MNLTRQEWGIMVLRLGLAALFLWFGFSQLIDAVNWTSWVPTWAVNLLHIPPAMIVLLNGSFEVIAGALLALNIWVRSAALLLALHLIVLVFEIGPSAIGVRDFGIMCATFALALLTEQKKRTAPSVPSSLNSSLP